MRETIEGTTKRVIIEPGEHFATNQRIIISTLLGSCVAACLYDPVNHVMGMNHFLLSDKRYPQNNILGTSESGRYGVHAMELLINNMLKMGAKKNQLKAKAFGGGNVLQSTIQAGNMFMVGEVNSNFVVEFLRNEKIPLISSDLGGDYGRVIHFYGNQYAVFQRKIKRLDTQEIAKREKEFLKLKIEKQKQIKADIQLWE